MDMFAARLREVRRSARFTQQQLACRIGVDRSVYAMYESGKLVPSPRLLERICASCAVASDALAALAAEADA